ncbi:MAG: DUF2191 domain-containing protein [Dehalococcoidia bacterium]|nr:DUF2191 domain-containing protein [Dehalococcoidia bacterium]
MRTTLTLDDDLVVALRERAQVLRKPFKQVVNDALRRGLSDSSQEQEPPTPEEGRPVFEVKPNHSGFAPGVDPLKLKELNAELENAEILRKLRT